MEVGEVGGIRIARQSHCGPVKQDLGLGVNCGYFDREDRNEVGDRVSSHASFPGTVT